MTTAQDVLLVASPLLLGVFVSLGLMVYIQRDEKRREEKNQ